MFLNMLHARQKMLLIQDFRQQNKETISPKHDQMYYNFHE